MWFKGFMVSLLSHLSLSLPLLPSFSSGLFLWERIRWIVIQVYASCSLFFYSSSLPLSPLLHFSLPLSVHFYVSLSRPLSLSLSPLLHFSRSSPTPPPPPSLSQNPLGNFLICCFMFVLLGRETFLNAKNKRKTNLWN